MSKTQPEDLSALQDEIHALVENDSSTPDSTDEEYTLRTTLANLAIGKVEAADILWDELWSTYTHPGTVAASTRSYSLATLTDRRAWGKYVRFTLDGQTKYIKVIKPGKYQDYGGEAKAVYFTGNNRDGWTMVLGWTPQTGDGFVGSTPEFDYYRYATKLSSSTDKSEIGDSKFIVYDVAATKSLLESKNNQFSIFSTEADRVLTTMKSMNELLNDSIDDMDAIEYSAVIGE